MARKKKQIGLNPEEILSDVVKDINKFTYESHRPLDIVSFSENLLNQQLYPAQKIILKWFYAGTRYNENLDITKKDIEIVKSWEIEQTWLLYGKNNKLDLLKEYKKDKLKYFTNLVLVVGRRSGKSFITALISVYEAYKLICLDDPQKYYGISSDIWIINTATNKDQAKLVIFKEIKRMIYSCPIFNGRIGYDTEELLWILTNEDLRKNKKIEEYGGKLLRGSVVVAAGSSNAKGLRGHTAAVCVYDEIAHFVENESSGKSNSEEVYYALAPSCLTLSNKGDGRNIAISSPDLAQGFFYDHFNVAKNNKGFLLFHLPTWDVNPNFPKDSDFIQNMYNTDFEKSNAEYGVRFRNTSGNNFFPFEKIDEAFSARDNWYKHKNGVPGNMYYMHLDPASTSDRYALMIAHPEVRYCKKSGSNVVYIVEDYSECFTPPIGGFLDPDDIIDNHIFPLFKKFRIFSVTYDAMFSLEQRKKFNKKRIPHRNISFAGRRKNELYMTVLDFFINNRFVLCIDDEQLRGETKSIVINYRKNPPKITNTGAGEYPHDDLVDCLCGVTHSILLGAAGQSRLPRISSVQTRLR